MKDEYFKSILDKSINGKEDSDSHLLSIFAIAISIKAKNIMELGVRGGTTTLPLLMAASISDGSVQSVDIQDTQFICPKEYKNMWKFHKKDAIDFLKECNNDDPYDLIYIDDWHAYGHVKQELELIDKLISPTGVVLLHDLMYGNSQPFYHCDITLKDGQWAEGGPYRAVAELNPQFWEFATIPSCNGLTILRKKYSRLYWGK